MELFLDVPGAKLWSDTKMLHFLFLAYLFIEYVETTVSASRLCWRAAAAGVRCQARCWAVCRSAASRPRLQLLRLPRHHAGYADGRLSCHQRRGLSPCWWLMPAYWIADPADGHQSRVRCLRGLSAGLRPPQGPARSLRGGYTGHADEVDCHERHERAIPSPSWKATPPRVLSLSSCSALVFGLIVEGVGEMSSPRCWAG